MTHTAKLTVPWSDPGDPEETRNKAVSPAAPTVGGSRGHSAWCQPPQGRGWGLVFRELAWDAR